MNGILKHNECIVLGSKYNNEKIPYIDIMFFESFSNYVQIVTVRGNKYLYRATMSSLEKTLLSHDFVRIHSGFLVSMSKIKCNKKETLELTDGRILKVSRKYLKSFQDTYFNYLRG